MTPAEALRFCDEACRAAVPVATVVSPNAAQNRPEPPEWINRLCDRLMEDDGPDVLPAFAVAPHGDGRRTP